MSNCSSCNSSDEIDALPVNNALSLHMIPKDPGVFAGDIDATSVGGCCQTQSITLPCDCNNLEAFISSACSSSSCSSSCSSTAVTSCRTTCVGSTPLCCESTAIVAQPYYQTVSICAEDNTKTVTNTKLVAGIRNANTFAMPACAASIVVKFVDIADIAIGTMIWATGVGYLEVTAFDAESGELTLRNNCPDCDGQATPGTPIDAETLFAISAPVCLPEGVGYDSIYPYLDSGFVAPANAVCIDIAVTNVNGLSVNHNVTIKNGTYRVSAIISPTLITICNDGGGITPGTVVDYLDGGGNHIVPVVLLDSSPCLNSAELSGKLLVCKNNIVSPIAGTQDGQIPVYNSGTGEVDFRTLAIPVAECTELTVCLTLDPLILNPTPYLITVVDTSGFAPGDIITIGASQFSVDSIASPTQMRVIPLAQPVAIQVYNPGTLVCGTDCCTRVEILEDYVINNTAPSGQWLSVFADVADAVNITNPTILNAGSPLLEGNVASLAIVNSSSAKTLKASFTIDWVWKYDLIGADGNVQDISDLAQFYSGASGIGVPTTFWDLYQHHEFLTNPTDPGRNRHSRSSSFTSIVSVAPGATHYIRARASMNWTAGNATRADVRQLGTHMSAIGLALV